MSNEGNAAGEEKSVRSPSRVLRLRFIFFRFPDLLDVRGEVKIFARQPPGAVGTQAESHFIVIDGDVRVMVEFFRQVTDLVHEGQGVLEVAQRELFLDGLAFRQRPAGYRPEFSLDFSLRERHGIFLPCSPAPGRCRAEPSSRTVPLFRRRL